MLKVRQFVSRYKIDWYCVLVVLLLWSTLFWASEWQLSFLGKEMTWFELLLRYTLPNMGVVFIISSIFLRRIKLFILGVACYNAFLLTYAFEWFRYSIIHWFTNQ